MSIRFTRICATMLVVAIGSSFAQGVGLTYVDGDPEFAMNVGPLETAFSPSATADQKWGKRTDFGAGITVWESGGGEDSPEIIQTVSGLTPGTSYDLYAVYWSDNDENWYIQSGLASSTYTSYSWTGANGSAGIVGSVQGAPAALAQWEPAGVPPAGPPAQGIQLFTERVTNPATPTTFGTDDPLVMLLAKAGTAVADGSGNVQVYMNDLAAPGGSRRGWFDGVAYQPTSAAPLTPTATLNRDTGTITINNPTSVARSIKGIRIESVTLNASGSLNGPGWASTASGGNPNWTAIADPTVAVPAGTAPAATPYSSNLVETGTTNITLAANGGTLSLGNVWNRSPFDNFAIHLLLADDTVAVISPQVTGAARVLADLDGDGFINTTDYISLLNNLQTSVSTLTRVESLRKGDMNADGLVNFGDFAAFRAAYDIANGAGAFAQMSAAVPEPATCTLGIMLGALVAGFRRRRATTIAGALVACLVVTSASQAAVPFLKVDVNDRNGDSTVGPTGDNTVAGYTEFVIPGGEDNVAKTTASQTLNGYTITMNAVDAAGAALNVLNDRDRGAPSTSPTLNQLYDDFVFANTAVVGNGLDLIISSGVGAAVPLAPNSAYTVSLYSFDSGSTGAPQPRVGTWTDGNFFNTTLFTSSFSGAASPTTDIQYRYSAVARTDATGKLLLKGRNAGAAIGIFLNGIELSVVEELTLEVNTLTGAGRILNEQGVSFDMSYYEILSAGGSLKTGAGGWAPLDDGEAEPDPIGNGWDKVPASNSSILSETNLNSLKTFAPTNFAALGNIYQAGFPQDLRFLYAGPNETQLRSGVVKYVSTPPAGVPGDYNGNGVVDGADYVLWRNGGPLQNEVDNPGTVNAADYTAWRARFGNTSGSGSSLDGSAAVPEPASFALVTLALSLAFGLRRGR